jgi:Spy/CpxP family protein refolding chaperone
LKLRIFSKIGVVVVGIVLLAGAAFAQPPAGKPDAGPGDAPRWDRERLETVIIGKFSSELNLTPDQAEKFFPRFKQFQNQVEDRQRQQHDRRAELDRLSNDPNADKTKVNELLAAQGQSQQSMLDLKQQFMTDVSTFLSPQQISRCSILLDELPRRVQQFIEERRGRGDGPHGSGGGQGHGGRRHAN